MKTIITLLLSCLSLSAATLYPVMTDSSSRLYPGGQTNFATLNGTNTWVNNNTFRDGKLTATNANFYGQTNFGTIYASGQVLQFANTALREISAALVGSYGACYFNGIYNDGNFYFNGNGTVAAPRMSAAATYGVKFETGTGSSYTNIAAQAVYAQAGSSAVMYKSSGVIYQSVTAVGNVGTGEDDLISQTIAANILVNNGDRLRITAPVVCANNANAKTLKVYWNGTAVMSHSEAINEAHVDIITVIVTRTGAATQNISISSVSSDVPNSHSSAEFATGSAALSGAVVFKMTGEGVDNDDIIQKEAVIEILPAN